MTLQMILVFLVLFFLFLILSSKGIEELWLKQINDNCKTTTQKLLIGNKSDLEEERQVNRETGVNLARKFDIPYLETSAKYGDGVEEAFITLGQLCFDEMYKRIEHEDNDKKFEITTDSNKKVTDCWERFKESILNVFSKKGKNNS